MGAAIEAGLQMLESQKAVYKANAFRTIGLGVFLITDGGPTDSWENAARLVHEGEAKKKFKFFAVGVEQANFDILKQISVGEPIALKETRFRDLFAWLSSSLASVSQSNPGDKVKLEDPTGPKGWWQYRLKGLWRWAGACAIGTSHIKFWPGMSGPGACRMVETPAGPVIVAVVSDGAGSARKSGYGGRYRLH